MALSVTAHHRVTGTSVVTEFRKAMKPTAFHPDMSPIGGDPPLVTDADVHPPASPREGPDGD